MSSQGSQPYRLIDYLTQSVLYGIGSFVCVSFSGILSFFIYKQKKNILELEEAEPLLPQELFDLISSKYRQKLTQIQQQNQNLVKIPGKYLVRGEVESNQMIPSIDQKGSGVVYQRMQIDKIYMRSDQANQNIVEKRNELLDNKNVQRFELVNPVFQSSQKQKEARNWLLKKKQVKGLTEFESGSIRCSITNFGTKKTNVERALKPIAYIEKFNDTIKANLKIQAGTILIIGFTQNQIGIKIGDQVMVYGSVIFDLKNRILNFDIPDVIAKRKYDIQEIVSHHFNIKSIASFFLFSLGVFYAYKAATSYLKHRKIMQKYLSRRIRAADLKDSSW